MMYKVLIVEDEEIIRKGLIYSFDWQANDCIIVDEAENGKKGFDKILSEKPDIVLVDINMPLKNGIEMVKEAMEFHDFSAIIISGYDDFDYAKQAIEYGVVSYLLKPLDFEELEKALEIAKRTIGMKRFYSQQKKESENYLHIDILNDLDLSPNSFTVKMMLDYVDKNYQKKIVMSDLVDELNLSVTSLNAKFKEVTGTTFNDYLNRYRIQKSIKLIKEGKYHYYQVAEMVGFKDYKYFNHVFNKYIKMSVKKFEQLVLKSEKN